MRLYRMVLAKHTEKYGLSPDTPIRDLQKIMSPKDHHELTSAMKYPNGHVRGVSVLEGGNVCECGAVDCPDEYDHCTHGF